MTQDRWAPVLPSFGGRLAPRVARADLKVGSYNSLLESYCLARHSCLSIFTCHVQVNWLRNHMVPHHKNFPIRKIAKITLEDLMRISPVQAKEYLLDTLGHIRMSAHFCKKLGDACHAADINTIKRWWQTVDGLVLPILLTQEDPDLCYAEIDRMIKFGLENCANNYSHFISRMKSLKRLLRKEYAEMTDLCGNYRDVWTYRKLYKALAPKSDDPHEQVRYILLWSQTRASGMADSVMVRKSLDKCEDTLSTLRRPAVRSTVTTRNYTYRDQPEGVPVLPPDVLSGVTTRIYRQIRGETAHVSAGPNACLESTRQQGGQTGFIKKLATHRVLRFRYDFRTLERVPCTPSRVSSVDDLVNWSIQETLEHPTYVRCVRLHSVAEPSKARTITVCSLPYLTIVGVISKLLQPSIASDISRTGLKASRNLWKFLFEDLDPKLGLWGDVRPNPYKPERHTLYALSSDLSEATDYGDLSVARQILHGILDKCALIPGFPTGLALLAKTLFIGKRFCIRMSEDGRMARYFVKRNGWLMGDRLTKVILTLAHEIVLLSCGLYTSRICGDDVIALSTSVEELKKYFHEVRRLGFKVSEEDSYISPRLLFYCEEAAVVPQQYNSLPAVCCRRRVPSCYVDYPRLRLLIPTKVETQAYSYTDVGRFALLGKEMRWNVQTNGPVDLFWRATLLQHLSVPQSSDTLCPFIPIEIGGDGACCPNPQALASFVSAKSRDLSETHYRMRQLLESKWGYRYIRSPVLNDVVHKYHLLLPRIQALEEVLSNTCPEAILKSDGFLLQSIRIDGIEDPERTFFRLWRSYYWDRIFATGKEPPDVLMDVGRHHSHGDDGRPLNEREFERFWATLMFEGFTYRNTYDYRIISNRVVSKDYMNMGWGFGTPPTPNRYLAEERMEIFRPFMINERNTENFLLHLATNVAMDPLVREALHKYVDADAYILYDISKRWTVDTVPDVVILVSQDKRLLEQISRIQLSLLCGNTGGRLLNYVMVEGACFLVHPADYQVGHVGDIEDWIRWITSASCVEVIADFGAIAYQNANSDGFGVVFDKPFFRVRPLRSVEHSHRTGCFTVSIDREDSIRAGSSEEAVSLTRRPRRELSGLPEGVISRSRSPSPNWRRVESIFDSSGWSNP